MSDYSLLRRTCIVLLVVTGQVFLVVMTVLITKDVKLSGYNMATLPTTHHDKPDGWKFPAFFLGSDMNFTFKERWVSQVGQDKTIVEILHGRRNGFFVDLAANHAVELSNTLTLEQEYGWNGLCVEPNLDYLTLLLRRRCQVAVAAAGRENNDIVKFRFHNVYGGIVGNEFDNKQQPSDPSGQTAPILEMRTVTLEKMFNDFNVPSVVDYLSLDIEGAEMFVFEPFPWHKYTFLTVTVERPKAMTALLENNGYVFIKELGFSLDQLWVHKSIPNLNEIIQKFGKKTQQ